MSEVDCSALGLALACVLVCPDLDVVAEALAHLIKIINEDVLLSCVAVKPFVLRLEIE